MWGLYGADWKEKSGYKGEPKKLQPGDTVGKKDNEVKHFYEATGGLNPDNVVKEYNKKTGEKLDNKTLLLLFRDADKSKEKLMENVNLHKTLSYKLNEIGPNTLKDAEKSGWIKMSYFKNWYHNANKNVKFVSPDGHRERVFDKKSGNPETDVLYMATFNFFDPNTDSSGHWKADVDPYDKWGN